MMCYAIRPPPPADESVYAVVQPVFPMMLIDFGDISLRLPESSQIALNGHSSKFGVAIPDL